jgi:hypothetical protein
MQIASLEDTATLMGQISKLMRLLASSGVTSEHLQCAIDSKSARANLVEFLQADCPKVDYTAPVPKAKLVKKEVTQTFDEPAFFQTRSGLWVDSDLRRYVGVEVRPTRPHTALKRRPLLKNEREDVMFGKRDSLEHAQTLAKACDLGQIAGKIEMQKNGEEGELLTDGSANLFPVRGLNGALHVVNVGWDADFRRWCVRCYPFKADGGWNAGNQVFSNQVFGTSDLKSP